MSERRTRLPMMEALSTSLAAWGNNGWVNAVLAVLAVVAATYQAFSHPRQARDNVVTAPSIRLSASVEPERLPDGTRVLRDASGRPIPLREFRRIASASTVADQLLVRLCDPERIVAFTARSGREGPAPQLYRGKARIETTENMEAILAMKPDLLLLNTLGDHANLRRLEAAGLFVFDLGAMRGLPTLIPSILSLGWLIGEPERARAFAERFERRLRAVASDIPLDQRKRALYVGVHGSKMYGGTRGSSFADILRSAGLEDVAAQRFEGWPSYTPEQMLELDPEIIVTQTNMAESLCAHTELGRLRVCSGAGTIVEVDPVILGSSGVYMLEAAERVRDAVYGPPGVPRADQERGR